MPTSEAPPALVPIRDLSAAAPWMGTEKPYQPQLITPSEKGTLCLDVGKAKWCPEYYWE